MKHLRLIVVAAAAALCASTNAQNTRTLYTSGQKMNVELLSDAPQGQSVQITRQLMAGYNTICLPVTLSGERLQQCAKDVQVERMGAIRQEGSTLNMYFLDCTSEGIEAGVPYLIFSPTRQTLRVNHAQDLAISTKLQTVTLKDDNGNQVSFDSGWEAKRVDGRYGIPAQQDAYILESVLVRTEADKVFLPTRCGFTWDNQSVDAQNLEIKHVSSLDAMATSVDKLEAEGTLVDVYTPHGTLVKKSISVSEARSSLPRGLYVIGGEKVAIQ